MRRLNIVLLSLAFACSGGSEVEVTPEPPAEPTSNAARTNAANTNAANTNAANEPPSADGPNAAEDAPPPDELAPAPPRQGTAPVVVLPDPLPRLPTLTTRRRMVRVSEDAWGGEDGYYPIITTPVAGAEGAAEGPAADDESATDESAGEESAGGSEITSIDGGLRTRLNALMAHGVDRNPDYPDRCRGTLVRPDLLSLICEHTEVYERGGAETYWKAEQYELSAEEPRRLSVASLVSPTGNLEAEMHLACRRAIPRANNRDTATRTCEALSADGELWLTPRGIMGDTGEYDENYGPLRFFIPYSRLNRAIYADTALGRALAALPGASVEEIELPPGTLRAGEERMGTVFGEPSRPRELIGRWLTLPAELRAGLVMVPAEGRQRVRLALPSEAAPDPARVETIATSLGASAPGSWSRMATLQVVRTRVETNFRNFPGDRETTLIIPPGTLLAAAIGHAGRGQSAIGRRGTWALTATAPGVAGYTAGALVEPYEGCEPDPSGFYESLPEAHRAHAARTLVRALVELRTGAERREVVAFGANGWPGARSGRENSRSHVAIYARDESCALGHRLGRYDVDGVLSAMRFVNTTAHGGQPLLLVGTYHRYPQVRWQLFELGARDALWTGTTHRNDRVRTEFQSEGEYSLVRVENREGEVTQELRWVEGELVEVPQG